MKSVLGKSQTNGHTSRRGSHWLWIGTAAILFIVIADASSLWAGEDVRSMQVIPLIISSPIAFWLLRKDRASLGGLLLMSAIGIYSTLAVLAYKGIGIPLVMTSSILIWTVGLGTMPRRWFAYVLAAGLFAASVTVLIDLFGSPFRPTANLIGARWVFSVLLAVVFGILFASQFLSLGIRTKIVLGIIITGGFALGFLSFFALDRAERITSSLAGRLETSVSLLAEEQLINQVSSESALANRFFEDIAVLTNQLANYRGALQDQRATLSQGAYWDARLKLTQMAGGKYGNPLTDISSVFVPSTVEISDSVISELNTSAFLDFSVPQWLEANPALLAIYYIDTRGIVRYYPNIDLASLLPPDFDATERPYFEITSPLFNPQRVSRWTIPYVDAAGGGLVVTVADPVYIRDRFSGVVAADVQLSRITERISNIKVGQSGYAFMIDDAGRVISLPPQGYEFFRLDPNEFPPEEYFKQTILGKASTELNAISNRMVAGGSGLNVVPVDGVDYYIAYSQIPSNGYTIAVAVPVSEMQTAFALAQNETETQIRSAARTAGIILTILLLGAILVSLVLGQVIAAPILRLTRTANQILEGDLYAQAEVTSRDESGTLAQAFNAMTKRLRETLEGLELSIEERTSQLAEANARNEKRAKQFQSIAQVARTISSTLDLENLLDQITSVISQEFGYYHVGVFLIDTAGEYAVLSAANSTGGGIMLEGGHRLKVGEKGLVGLVASTGRPRVALNTETDSFFFNNPDLPETRSEIALPLRAGGRVSGVLDVQSTESNAFSQEDIAILSALADQVSIAIQNARQNEETQKALAESEALAKQFVQTGWSQFLNKRRLLGVRHTGAKATLLYSKKSKGGNENAPTGTGPLKSKTKGAVLSMPIKLRGELIGTVDVLALDNRRWDQDEIDIVTAIIDRAAIAMENSRLLADSQKQAAKERVISNISASIGAQSDVGELLKIAALELNRNMPGTEVSIQFRKDEEE